jgi:hypothetical protein
MGSIKSKKTSELIQDARRMERNEAYEEAIKTWENIRDLDPAHSEIDRAIQRLEKINQQKEIVNEILRKLSSRMQEIKQIYASIARRLKRMVKEGIEEEGEVVLEIVEKFLSGELSTSDFTEMWEQMDVNQPQRTEEPNYDILADRLNRGEIILFLGPETRHLFDLPLPSSEELVQKLADYARYQDFTGPLSMISQYYQMTEYQRSTLRRKLKEFVEPESFSLQSVLPYQLLANIKPPIIVISVSYDSLLESAFQKIGKRFVVVSHLTRPRTESDFGKILIKYPEKSTPEDPCLAEALSGLNLLERGYSLIYKIYGCFELYNPETADEIDSLMISEEDYFSFAKQIERLIPSYLVRQFSGRSFLFLGHNLKEWQDKLVVNAILEKKRTQRERSYVVQKTPNLYERAYWKFNGVDMYEVQLREFVEKLNEKTLLT